MNCQLCRKELEAYRLGSLPGDNRTLVEAHLHGCRRCAEFYRLLTLAERVMSEEKEVQSNPFLSTRIMARIEDIKSPVSRSTPVFTRLAKPVILVILLAIVITMGVMIGSMYRYIPDRGLLPAEMALIDDEAIESVSILSNDQN